MDQNKLSLELGYLGVPSGVSKTIPEPTLHLAQAIHLSCTDTNTILERTETRFDMTHVTKELHRVCPKRFMSLRYVLYKLCTYLASGLALSLNRPKRASTWASLPRSSIRFIQNKSRAYGMFGINRAPILERHQHRLQTDRNEIRHDPHHLRVPSSASKMVSEPMVCSVQIMHLSYTDTNMISKQNEMRFHTTHVT
jgi:hypothetical protein